MDFFNSSDHDVNVFPDNNTIELYDTENGIGSVDNNVVALINKYINDLKNEDTFGENSEKKIKAIIKLYRLITTEL